jgi:hypothetical protein
MRAARCWSKLRLLVPLAAVTASLAVAVGAQAQATVEAFEFQQAFTDTVDDSGTCLGPGAVGTITGTEHVVGQFTDTYPPKRGFHVHGTNTTDYRIDYSDGRYTMGTSVAHFDYNDNPDQLTTTNTEAAQDHATLYAPDGEPLGPVTIHALFHLTYSDTNGNRRPDPGEISAYVDHFRMTCP